MVVLDEFFFPFLLLWGTLSLQPDWSNFTQSYHNLEYKTPQHCSFLSIAIFSKVVAKVAVVGNWTGIFIWCHHVSLCTMKHTIFYPEYLQKWNPRRFNPIHTVFLIGHRHISVIHDKEMCSMQLKSGINDVSFGANLRAFLPEESQ